MARPKEFSPDEALLKAIQVFWSKGFAATSMEDLVQAMGINRASLYNAFGNKHTLYMKALETYRDSVLLPPMRLFAESGDMLAGLAKFQDEAGCFLLGCMSELSAHDSDVDSFVASSIGAMRELVRDGVARERAAGRWAGVQNDDEAASLVLTCLIGMRALGKGGLTAQGHAGMALLARMFR